MAGVACGKIDIKQFPQDEIVVIGDVAWAKADIEEKLQIWRGRPSAILKLSAALVTQYCDGDTNLIPTLLMTNEATETVLDVTVPAPSGSDNPSAAANPPDDSGAAVEAVANALCATTGSIFLLNAQSAVDAYSINDKGYQGKAVAPTIAAVPMRSNVRVYGPYASANFAQSFGGANVRVEPDLCPWVFGSYAKMNAMGYKMANSINIGLAKGETGSVTIPGLPKGINPGTRITLGLSIEAGPNLSSFSFNFGGNGASTTYEFKTFTPKIGDMTRLQVEQIKFNNQQRNQQLKFLREDRVNAAKQGRKITQVRGIISQMSRGGVPSTQTEHSLVRVMVGETYDIPLVRGTFQNPVPDAERTVVKSTVGIDTMAKSATEGQFDYARKAMISMDGLYSPVSLFGGGVSNDPTSNEYMTRMAQVAYPNGMSRSCSHLPVPPVNKAGDPTNGAYNLSINNIYLNPIVPAFPAGGHHHIGPGLGHNIDIVGRESTVPLGSLNCLTPADEPSKYSLDYRFMAMRGPLMLHSWGYDLEGKPVPNAADTENQAKQGLFVHGGSSNSILYSPGEDPSVSGLKDAFLKDWLSKPSTWPNGPIDLRWDRNRGVWVSPPSHKIVVVQAKENILNYETGNGILINRDQQEGRNYGDEIWDKDGKIIKADGQENLNQTSIRITDRLGAGGIGAGERGYAFFDPWSSEYLMLTPGTTIRLGKFCNQWPSLSNVKDPRNAIKRVVLYKQPDVCQGASVTDDNCPWSWEPETEIINGIVTPKTVEVINMFCNVAAAEYQTKWCAFYKAGSSYILLAAEC